MTRQNENDPPNDKPLAGRSLRGVFTSARSLSAPRGVHLLLLLHLLLPLHLVVMARGDAAAVGAGDGVMAGNAGDAARERATDTALGLRLAGNAEGRGERNRHEGGGKSGFM